MEPSLVTLKISQDNAATPRDSLKERGRTDIDNIVRKFTHEANRSATTQCPQEVWQVLFVPRELQPSEAVLWVESVFGLTVSDEKSRRVYRLGQRHRPILSSEMTKSRSIHGGGVCMLESPQVGATLMGPNSTSDMEMGDQLGTLEPSKLADIVLVDGNPLEGYWNLLRAKATINEGKIVADHRWRTSFSGWGHMHCAAAVIVAIVWFGAAFTAQEFPTGNATVLAFDVVSIKSLAGIARARMPGARRSQGRFARASATLRQLAEYAYYVQPL